MGCFEFFRVISHSVLCKFLKLSICCSSFSRSVHSVYMSIFSTTDVAKPPPPSGTWTTCDTKRKFLSVKLWRKKASVHSKKEILGVGRNKFFFRNCGTKTAKSKIWGIFPRVWELLRCSPLNFFRSSCPDSQFSFLFFVLFFALSFFYFLFLWNGMNSNCWLLS